MHYLHKNNFDLIRLFAAVQVCIRHAAGHLNYKNPFLEMFSYLPGVPIFFFVSGFLIYSSFENTIKESKPLKIFFLKRVLRLYPALIVCLIFSILTVYNTGYFDNLTILSSEFGLWVIAQATFVQFYNPDFLRGYGVGVLNGSLWTISVEIQFYLLMPLIFILLKKISIKSILLMFIILIFFNLYNSHANEKLLFAEKLYNVSFLPWLYMFLLGVFFCKYKRLIYKALEIPFFVILPAFILVFHISEGYGWGNRIHPIGFLLLSILIIKLAFSCRSLSNTILNKNDISYGVYIFHMPIVNYLIFNNIYGLEGVLLTVLTSIVIGIISWYLVEKKFLRMKKLSIRKI